MSNENLGGPWRDVLTHDGWVIPGFRDGGVMAVYVDNFRTPARIRNVRGRWSHLTADTQDELHAFAAQIGLKREWFQICKRQCHSTLPCVHWHYDVVDSKRAEAIAAGAQDIDIRYWSEITNARRVTLLTKSGDTA